MELFDNIKDYQNNLIKHSYLINLNKNLSYWGFVPCNVNHLKHFYSIYENNMSMIDLGCGIGNVMRFAKNIGYDVQGVELNKELIKYNPYSVITSNLFNIDFKAIERFDIVFSYKPIKKGFDTFLNEVVNNMKLGSYLITPEFEFKNEKLKQIERFYYKKIHS